MFGSVLRLTVHGSTLPTLGVNSTFLSAIGSWTSKRAALDRVLNQVSWNSKVILRCSNLIVLNIRKHSSRVNLRMWGIQVLKRIIFLNQKALALVFHIHGLVWLLAHVVECIQNRLYAIELSKRLILLFDSRSFEGHHSGESRLATHGSLALFEALGLEHGGDSDSLRGWLVRHTTWSDSRGLSLSRTYQTATLILLHRRIWNTQFHLRLPGSYSRRFMIGLKLLRIEESANFDVVIHICGRFCRCCFKWWKDFVDV